MKSWLMLLVLPTITLATPLEAKWKRSGSMQESQSLPADLQDYIVREHNRLRGKVSPRASNMKTIRWDDEVARYATNWARCQNFFQHSSGDYGENLFVSYGSGLEDNVKAALNGWWAEGEDYDYYSDTCAPGKMCLHYTQMAWADTYAIGCGYASNCPGQMMDFFLVCSYKERGNWMGEKPYSTK